MWLAARITPPAGTRSAPPQTGRVKSAVSGLSTAMPTHIRPLTRPCRRTGPPLVPAPGGGARAVFTFADGCVEEARPLGE